MSKICPNCFKEIEYVFVYSIILTEGLLNEEGEVRELVNEINSYPKTFVCPECDNIIPMVLSKECKW